MSVEQAVCDRIDSASEDLVGLASDLIAFDTTTRGESDDPARDEQPLQEMLAGRLEEAGAEVELWEPAPGALDEWSHQVPVGLGFEGRPQLAARFPGKGNGRSLIFNGHVDVVSGDPVDRWESPPFSPEVREGRLYGRGSCDMKGGVASMVVAAEALAAEGIGLAGDLVVNTVTDEEWNGAGTLAVAANGLKADAAVIPEPTDFGAWIACRGVHCVDVVTTGRPGHAEMPQPDWREGGAVNAIEKAMPLLEAVRELREEWSVRGSGHELLKAGELIPTVIAGGEWWVTYPASCRFTVDITYLPEQGDPDGGWGSGIENEIEGKLRAAVESDAWMVENPPEFEWGTNLPPAEVQPGAPIIECVLESSGSIGRPAVVSAEQGWHDAATLTRFGTPAISFGPAGLSGDGKNLAHALDEYVPVEDLVDCAKAMAVTAIRWCGS